LLPRCIGKLEDLLRFLAEPAESRLQAESPPHIGSMLKSRRRRRTAYTGQRVKVPSTRGGEIRAANLPDPNEDNAELRKSLQRFRGRFPEKPGGQLPD
jgi:hypothetical protein